LLTAERLWAGKYPIFAGVLRGSNLTTSELEIINTPINPDILSSPQHSRNHFQMILKGFRSKNRDCGGEAGRWKVRDFCGHFEVNYLSATMHAGHRIQTIFTLQFQVPKSCTDHL
jgi:hypothetical protein